eukprot:scaffold1671_cov344-Pavlova_lutheri.AAC.47
MVDEETPHGDFASSMRRGHACFSETGESSESAHGEPPTCYWHRACPSRSTSPLRFRPSAVSTSTALRHPTPSRADASLTFAATVVSYCPCASHLFRTSRIA